MRLRPSLHGLHLRSKGEAAARHSHAIVLLGLLATSAGATPLDFSSELQSLAAGARVERVALSNGATMDVVVENAGGGPDLAIVFDSAHPTAGNVLIIAENDTDANDDGLVDEPEAESGGGIVWLRFSHAGYLDITVYDVDEGEDGPRFVLFRDGERIGEVEGEALGDNSAQHFELRSHGSADLVEIHLDGSASLGDIVLEVPAVGVEPSTWTDVKKDYR